MKTILIALLLLSASIVTKAQEYDSSGRYQDTLITLTLTQRSAIYIAYNIKQRGEVWQNWLAPSTLKPYVGTGTHMDSLFSVVVKASYITGLIDLLLTGQNEMVQADRLSIINASPSIPGYTSLATQIVNKANGSSSEKNVATYVLNYYNAKVASLSALRTQVITDVVKWTQY